MVCVRFQDQIYKRYRRVGYWSPALNDKEQYLIATHRECLAVVCAVTVLPSYLEETRFSIRTDHEAFS